MLFDICLAIGGMTVGEMCQRMSGAEFTKWLAFFKEKNRREAAEMRRQQRQARR